MRKWQASVLLIEGKASGLTVHQELRRLHFDENWSVQLVNPKGDKIVRALAAQPTFAQGLVYAPVKDWSQMVIDEMELFPKGRYDDLTNSTTMAVSFLRSSGILQTDAEAMAAEENTVMHRPQRRLESFILADARRCFCRKRRVGIVARSGAHGPACPKQFPTAKGRQGWNLAVGSALISLHGGGNARPPLGKV